MPSTLVRQTSENPINAKCVEGGCSEVRKDHSFGVCAPAPLGTIIRLSLSRTPSEIPLPRAPGFSLACAPVPAVSYVRIEDLRGVSYIRIDSAHQMYLGLSWVRPSGAGPWALRVNFACTQFSEVPHSPGPATYERGGLTLAADGNYRDFHCFLMISGGSVVPHGSC